MTEWAWIAVGAGAVAAFVAAVFVVLRLARVRLVGPMFWYELVRLARKGTQPRLRALLVGLLMVGLLVAYLREFRGLEREALLGGAQLPLDRTARFAETFLIAFSTAQLVAVMLITPAVVGGTITEEKERGTLDYLRGSMLLNREIILGKLAARLAFVGGIVLAGAPVLALTFLFGGVDFRVLIAAYLITAVTAVALGAFSLLMAVHRDGLRDVLIWVYGAVGLISVPSLLCGCCIPGVAACSPPSVMLYLFVGTILGTPNPSEPLFWLNPGLFTLFYGSLSVLFTVLAINRIRGAAPRRRGVPRRPRNELALGDPPPWKPLYVPEGSRPRRGDDWEEVPLPYARRPFTVIRLTGTADPLLWKERYFSGRMAWFEGGLASGCGIAILSAVLFVLGMILFVGVQNELDQGRWPGGAVNGPLRTFAVGAVLAIGLAVGLRAAGSVARERQKQTLDALLTLPVRRRDLLRAKAVAPLVWVRYGLIGLVIALFAGLFSGGVHPVGFAAGVAQAAAELAFLAALGVWLSVKCRTVNRATVIFLVWALGIVFVPVLAALVVPVLMDAAGFGAWADAAATVVRQLSPPVGLWNGLMAWDEFNDPRQTANLWVEAGGWALAAGGYGLAAVGLGLDAVRVFEREGR